MDKVIQPDFLGVNAVYHGFAFMPEQTDKGIESAPVHAFDPPLRDVTAIRLLSTKSPSWISWSEISFR